MANELPDFNLNLRVATDFIFSTKLCRKACEHPFPGGTANIIRDLVKSIETLSLSCHLPEFTDHALPHIVSVVDRASNWILIDGDSLVDRLTPIEAALMVFGLLTHDIGMLSQDPLDLGEGHSFKGMSDVASWVRKTHCARLRRLLQRTLRSFGYEEFVTSGFFELICRVGMAHEEWSWQSSAKHYPRIREIIGDLTSEGNTTIGPDRACGIAAVVAVCDLLDEDYLRCDTDTLLSHRQGTPLNRAHWIRHLITRNRVEIKLSQFFVSFGRLGYVEDPRGWRFGQDPSFCQNEERYEEVLKALKNQFSSALLYNSDLAALNAELTEPVYDEVELPINIPWNLPALREFWGCGPERLLQSVFAFAREPELEVADQWKKLSGTAAFNELNLDRFHRFLGIRGEQVEPLVDEEITANSIAGANL